MASNNFKPDRAVVAPPRHSVGTASPQYRYGVLSESQKAQLLTIVKSGGSGGEVLLLMMLDFYNIAPATAAMMLGISLPRAYDLRRSAENRVKNVRGRESLIKQVRDGDRREAHHKTPRKKHFCSDCLNMQHVPSGGRLVCEKCGGALHKDE